MKKIVCLLFVLACFSQAKAQVEEEMPPPMLMPSQKNSILIDEILQKTAYEKYFCASCDRAIKAEGKKKGWSVEEQKHRSVKAYASFELFKKFTIYNTFSSYSKEELEDMLKLIIKVNSKAQNLGLIFTNEMLQNNLELHILQFLE